MKRQTKRQIFKRQLQVRLPENLDVEFTARAEKLGIDRSALARMLIAAAIDPTLAKFWVNYNRTVQHLGLAKPFMANPILRGGKKRR